MNDTATIQASFETFYRTTILADETDPNKLHDLKAAVDEFVNLYLGGADRDRLDPILGGCGRL